MSQDIKLFQDKLTGQWDIDVVNGDFALTSGLDTALYLSVLGEARADESLVPNPILRKGHFTDIFSDVEGYEIGSLMWIYSGLPNTPANAELLKDSITTSLKWMIDDGIIKDAEVIVTRTTGGYTVGVNLTNESQEQGNYYDLFVKTFK